MRSWFDYSKCRKDARGVYVLGYSQIENSIDSFLKKSIQKFLPIHKKFLLKIGLIPVNSAFL